MTGKLIKIAGLIIVAAALSAPVATAMRIDEPGSPAAQQGTVLLDPSSIYATGCKNGTIPGATGGGNNNYDYFGNLCDTPTTLTGSPAGIAPSEGTPSTGAAHNGSTANAYYAIACKNGTISGATGGDNNNYDYYGNPCASW